MIDHQPYGIDDPYKRLPTERFPRDPEAGEAVQINFAAPAATEAWVALNVSGVATRHPAQRVSSDLWTSHLPKLESGAYTYTIHACAESCEETAGPFDLPVGRWRRAERVGTIEAHGEGTRLTLLTGDGGTADLNLFFPEPGVCKLDFRPGGAPSLEDKAADGAVRQDGLIIVSGEGVEVRIDEDSLALTLHRPGDDVPRARGTAIEWLELPGGEVTQFRITYALSQEELYGLGERFVGPGLRGRSWDVRVYEEYKEQGGRSYLPVPFFVSSSAWGMWLDTDAPSYLDACGEEAVITADAARGEDAAFIQHLIVADAPYGVTSVYTRLTGDIALPPRWAFGPWMSANTWNSQSKAEAAVRRTVQEDVPATVIVLEAWSDESTFYIFNDAEYEPVPSVERLRLSDFRFGGRWPDPKRMVDELHDRGVRVLLWQIPVQKRLDAPHPQHDADEAHMLERGYAIHNADGSPYRNKGWWFTDALVLDVTYPEALDWWLAKRQYLFDELGIDGLKTDGGEHLWGRDLVAHNGQRGVELVNRYPQMYIDAYHAFVRRMTDGDGLTFSRAGYTGAQRSPAHWAGDENSTWGAFRASIQAGLSAGLAGVSIWGWDIGGFSGEIPTVELYVRSAQMACFCPVMQYHSELHEVGENRDRTPWNIAERFKDPRALTVYRAYAKLRMRLLDYIMGEAEALAALGQPLMRYPGLVWCEAHDVLMRDSSVYLFGRDLLVCPVLEKGAQTREVTLPPGDWVDFWSGAHFIGNQTVITPAPLETLPVFVKADSPRLPELLEAAKTFEVA